MTVVWMIAAMLALVLMHNTALGYARVCPACGGRQRHHRKCPYREDA
jgi:ribosomal protein L32